MRRYRSLRIDLRRRSSRGYSFRAGAVQSASAAITTNPDSPHSS
jgi:hypothetical protein